MNRLGQLLTIPPVARTVDLYEATFDDLVSFSGGVRIDSRYQIPNNTLNADYLIERDDCEVILELKQINDYAKARSVDQYFERLLHRGRVRTFNTVSPTRLEILPESLSKSDWNDFYGKFRPNVGEHLDKAAKQIKATNAFLPATAKRRVGGVVIVNTGDYNVSVDLLARLIEFRTKRKWAAGRYSSIDFAMCFALDMVKDGQHPLHAPAICRTVDDPVLVSAVGHLYDRWIHYGAAAVGATVEFDPTGTAEMPPRQVSGGMIGKVRRVE